MYYILFNYSIRQNARFAKVDTGVVKTDTSIRCFPCNFALFGNELKEFFKHDTKDYGV